MKIKMFVVIMCIMFVAFASNVQAQSANANALTSSQAQGGGAFVDNSDNSINNIKNFDHVVPGNIPMPGTNGFFTSPTPDSSFRSAKELLRFGSKFTLGALKSMASGDVDVNYDVTNETVTLPEEKIDDDTRWFRIILDDGKIEGFSARAMVDAEADDADTNSVQVIAAAALKAFEDGCNVLVLTAEGAHRAVEANGWGVGFYTIGGVVSSNGTQAANGGGGTGYAHNSTAPEDRPWIQGYAGVIEDLSDEGVTVKE